MVTKRKPEHMKKLSLDDRIYAWLSIRAGKAFHNSEIFDQFEDYSWGSMRNALWRLHRAEKVVLVRPRWWTVTMKRKSNDPTISRPC
jgi:hypothetical protein